MLDAEPSFDTSLMALTVSRYHSPAMTGLGVINLYDLGETFVTPLSSIKPAITMRFVTGVPPFESTFSQMASLSSLSGLGSSSSVGVNCTIVSM